MPTDQMPTWGSPERFERERVRPIGFHNVRLIDPANGRDETGGLLIDEGKIADVGPHLTSDGFPEGAEVIDGGGNVLATLCDMTIAGESAIFGQVGPKMGSVDPGFGTAYLARVVGEKKAREIWYMCRRYPAREALAMGLANAVVPDDKLDEEVDAWCAELVERSPTAIAIAKKSFNADSDNIRGIGGLGMQALRLYYNSAESKEGVNALNEKRKPEFRKHMK